MIERNTQAGSGTFLLVDHVGNRIIPLSGVIPHGEDATHLSSLLGDGKRGTQYGTIGEEKMFASYYRMDNLDGLSLVFLSPRQFDLYLVRLLLVGLLGCGVVMIVVFSFWYERNIFRRLNRISHAMDTVEKDQFATTVVDTHADEISVLAESFNRMNTRLHELVNEVYVSKIREKESTIKTLRAYINPHFFFNTLDTICWMSRQENAFETCELVEALSTLFRSQLDAEYPIITVREEIDHVNQYLKIQNCRYAETIDFSVQCDDQCLTAMTVPSVIQPLVENAIYHGLEHSGSTGTIAITIRRTGEDLVIVVENTGEAVDADRLNELLSSYQEGKQGMAIYGINSRVKLQWGDAYGLGFTQRPGGGLVATIIQPFRERGVS
jgi:two-component system sensor histidine kinase YesM